ncbi:hypothetical protein PoB_003007400 [Plakobranchus ocellatus]|uniref:Uncharacterized protein n=1 Tax=Plakobranchus ocellatus TaxID=259542 RepID=A0AAV4ABE3_9GAST|nr:hypothetical protein PoB_003007400 [Plakobranchus ocellatus]
MDQVGGSGRAATLTASACRNNADRRVSIWQSDVHLQLLYVTTTLTGDCQYGRAMFTYINATTRKGERWARAMATNHRQPG